MVKKFIALMALLSAQFLMVQPLSERLGEKLKGTRFYWGYQHILGRIDQVVGFCAQDRAYQKQAIYNTFFMKNATPVCGDKSPLSLITFTDSLSRGSIKFSIREEEGVLGTSKYMHIHRLLVDSKYQKSGIGSALLKQACSYAKEVGCARISLYAVPFTREISLSKLVAFYAKFGFYSLAPHDFIRGMQLDLCKEPHMKDFIDCFEKYAAKKRYN